MSNTTKSRLILILISGLTFGHEMYQAGDRVPEAEAPEKLKALAEDGRLFLGKRWAKWENTKPEAPKTEDKVPDKMPDIVPEQIEETPVPIEPEAPKTEDISEPIPAELDEAIKHLVLSGKGKGAIVKILGESEDISQRQVSEQFDTMLATGALVAGEISGQYFVGE